MDDFAKGVLGRVKAFKQDVASELDEFEGHLHCDSCGYSKPIAAGDAGHYLFNGWPKHCGETMRWITKNEKK